MDTPPRPKAICLEDLRAASPSDRYLRCVALPGRQAGLGLGGQGSVLWQSDDDLACELWVSADDRLIAYRRDGAPPVLVRRAGRSLSAPHGKPVVLLDQDELVVGARHVRIHFHGPAGAIHPPAPLALRSGTAARLTAVAAAAVALSAAAGCNEPKTAAPPDAGIEVRETPPAAMPMPDPVPDAELPSSNDASAPGQPKPGN